MPGSTAPLLCELHAHTTFSDGELTPAELVDLYGAAGFDVLAITDHVCRATGPRGGARSVCAADHGRYLALIDTEAERARHVYGLLVIPGLELTYEDEDPKRSAHALAVGLRSWVGLGGGLDSALAAARAAGGRRCCPARRTRIRWSTACARDGKSRSSGSTRRPPACGDPREPPEGDDHIRSAE